MAGNIFERVEKKYLLKKEDALRLMNQISSHIMKDAYSDYTICNIYYDTDDYDLVRSSIEKPPYKEKMRIRSYGIPDVDDPIFIELKKKYMHTVFKRRVKCSLNEMNLFMEQEQTRINDSQIAREIEYFMGFYQPHPKLFLAYDRKAYKGICEADLRITMDQNIRYREDDLHLEHGDHGQPYFEKDMILMEIKVNQAYPLWLSHALTKAGIYPISFSKYGNIYRKDLVNNVRRTIEHV